MIGAVRNLPSVRLVGGSFCTGQEYRSTVWDVRDAANRQRQAAGQPRVQVQHAGTHESLAKSRWGFRREKVTFFLTIAGRQVLLCVARR